MEKHVALVCNPTRENAKALKMADQVSLLLSGMNIRHSIFTAYWPDKWDNISEAWIFGGDGTVYYFINQYPEVIIPLSVFPGGTGNDFHWMLYGNMKPEEQVDFILQCSPKQIDGGVCNGKLFLNGVGIGFDGVIVKDLLGKKKLAGKASYVLSILKHIISWHEKACTIEMYPGNISEECFMISIANAKRYGGGFCVAPKASVDDELLDLNIVGHISPVSRIRYLPVIEKGEHIGLPFIQYHQVKKVTISVASDVHAHIDGEYIFNNKFEIEVLPKRFSFLY
jgi:diacylglycerol kinase (ATP)